jgi:hypothetical protein
MFKRLCGSRETSPRQPSSPLFVDVDASRLPGNQADPAGIALNAGASLQQATAGVGGGPSLLFLPQVDIILCLRYVLLFFC